MSARMLLLAFLAGCAAAQQGPVTHARAYLFTATPNSNPSGFVGIVDFYQQGSTVSVNGSVNGLTIGNHGFHVHEKGDLGNGCLAAGAHYNPLKMNHGAPTATQRHKGDLGNIATTAAGTNINVRDMQLALNGQYSILGRALVVHEKPDDLGLGGTNASLTTGDAGARIACGVIGMVEEDPSKGSSASLSLLFAAVVAIAARVIL